MNYETATNQQLNSKLYDLKSGGYAAVIIPDYCTDWNATMPMAVDNGVCLKSPLRSDNMWIAIWNGLGGIWTPNELQIKNESPLRAIVICLIKVLETKNEQ